MRLVSLRPNRDPREQSEHMKTQPHMYDVLGAGISAVDDVLAIEHYPAHGAKVPVLDSARHGGGLACTAIAAAATLGGRTAFAARFGNDELSNFIRQGLTDRGVDISPIISDSAGRPYHSQVIVDRTTGERTIFYDPRHFKPVQAEDISADLLACTRLLLVDYIGGRDPADIIRKARSAGTPVLIDIEGHHPQSQMAPLLEQVTHLVVPEDFVRWQTGQNDLAAGCATLARTPRAATVVTAGADGCWWTDSPEHPPVHVPAFAVQAVNTNGCGDTFHGACALAVARGFSIGEAVVFASACAALKAAAPRSGWQALPVASQVVDFLRQRLDPGDPHRSLIAKVQEFTRH